MPQSNEQYSLFLKAMKASYKRKRPRRDAQELAFAFGAEIRLNLKEAFQAAGLAVTAGISLAHILAGKAEPADVAGLGGGFLIWSTFLNSIRRKITALQYVVCLVLSENSQGLTAEQILPRAREYAERALKMKPKKDWLGGGADVFKNALLELKNKPSPETFLRKMHEEGWIVKKRARFFVKKRHFTLGLTE